MADRPPRKIRWLAVHNQRGQLERGLFQLAYLYPDQRLDRRGFYFRYKPWGKTVYKGPFSSISAARQARASAITLYRQQRDQGIVVAPSRQTVATLITDYLTEQAGSVSEYRAQARYGRFWTERFPNRPILSVQPAEVRQARAALKQRGLTDATADHYVKFLRALMRRLVHPKGWVLEFWSQIRVTKAVPAQTRAIYTEAQEARLYQQLRPHDMLFCRLGYLCGIRGGQLASLRWEWMRWTVGKHGSLLLPKFKQHPPREIPLTRESRTIFRYLWRQQHHPEQGWIFSATNHPALPMNYHNWYNRHFRQALTDAKLTGLGLDFHALRHTWATRLGATTPTRVLQILGGWADISQVERYTQHLRGPMQEAMDQASRFGSRRAKKALTQILHRPQKKRITR